MKALGRENGFAVEAYDDPAAAVALSDRLKPENHNGELAPTDGRPQRSRESGE